MSPVRRGKPLLAVTRATLRRVEVTLSIGEREDLIRAVEDGRLDDVLSPWTRNRLIDDLKGAR